MHQCCISIWQAGSAELPDAWAAFNAATEILTSLTAWEDWGGEALAETLHAAAAQVLSARSDVLADVLDMHLSRLARFRTDPDACPFDQQLMTWQMLAQAPPASLTLFRSFQDDSLQAHQRSCVETLEGLAHGAPAEVWAYRLAHCVDVEAAIDRCSPNGSALAASCAATWLSRSLPLLPWILAYLISPTKELDLAALRRLRKALEVCEDSQALVQMRDALVNACTLLCRTALLQKEPVSWLTSLLLVMHEACQVLLPDITPGALAASLAVALAPALNDPGAQPELAPWEAVLGTPSEALNLQLLHTPSTDAAAPLRPEQLAESIARALHGEAEVPLAPGA